MDKIKNGNYSKKYFTQFPNIIDDSELDPFEFRILMHYYRVGECTQGVRTTAKICKMSIGKVADVRKTLEQKGFITISSIGESVAIEVVDKYHENGLKYRSGGEHSVQEVNTTVQEVNNNRSPGEHKKNPSKKNPLRIDYAKLASQVLAIFNIVDKRYSPSSHGCKVTDERKNLIKNRESEFKKLWPDADFLKSCEFVFDYKAKEWVYTDQWKYFEIETIFARKHFIQYCEQAKKNKGTPPQAKKINGHQKSEQPITAKPSNWDKVESK